MTRNSCNESQAPLREQASRPRRAEGKPTGAARLGKSSSMQIPSNSSTAPKQGRQTPPPGKKQSILLNNWVLRNAARALGGSWRWLSSRTSLVYASDSSDGAGWSVRSLFVLCKGWGSGTGRRYGNGGRESHPEKLYLLLLQ